MAGGSFADIAGGAGNFLGGLGVLAGLAGDNGQFERRQAMDLWSQIQRPNFDIRELPPPQLQIVARYFPSLYNAKLRDVALTKDSPEARRAMQGALGYFQSVQNRGFPLAEEISAREAQRAAQGAYQSTVQGGLRDLSMRGMRGSGAETGLRLGAQQQSANLSRDLGEAMIRERVANRFRGAQQAGSLASLLRSQDVGVSAQQAGEMNRYNALVMGLLTQAARDNARSQQLSQAQNASLAQGVSNANTMARYGNSVRNQEYGNRMGQQNFSNQVAQIGGETGAMENYAAGQDAQEAANRDNIMGLARGLGELGGGVADWLATGKTSGYDNFKKQPYPTH